MKHFLDTSSCPDRRYCQPKLLFTYCEDFNNVHSRIAITYLIFQLNAHCTIEYTCLLTNFSYIFRCVLHHSQENCVSFAQNHFLFITSYSNPPNTNWSSASRRTMHSNRTNLNNNIFHTLHTKCHNNKTMRQNNRLK